MQQETRVCLLGPRAAGLLGPSRGQAAGCSPERSFSAVSRAYAFVSLDRHRHLDLFATDFYYLAYGLQRRLLGHELHEAEASSRPVFVVVHDEGFVDLSEAAEHLVQLRFVAGGGQAFDVHLPPERVLLLFGHFFVQRELLHVDLESRRRTSRPSIKCFRPSTFLVVDSSLNSTKANPSGSWVFWFRPSLK